MAQCSPSHITQRTSRNSATLSHVRATHPSFHIQTQTHTCILPIPAIAQITTRRMNSHSQKIWLSEYKLVGIFYFCVLIWILVSTGNIMMENSITDCNNCIQGPILAYQIGNILWNFWLHVYIIVVIKPVVAYLCNVCKVLAYLYSHLIHEASRSTY